MGASSGMGREIALLLARQGWTVGAAARRLDKLIDLQKTAISSNILVKTIDVNDPSAPLRIAELIDEMGGLDLYVHAAGVGHQNMGLEAGIELGTVQTNALGWTRCVTAVYNHMAAHGGGHIAVISSIAGTKGLGAAPAYSATKAMQNVYIQALEQQAHMRRLPITFTDVRPGFVNTALLADGHAYPMLMNPKRAARQIVRAIAQRRHIAVIDWRYRLLTAAWRRVPRWLWRRLNIHTKK